MALLGIALLQPADSTRAQSAPAADKEITVPTDAEAWYNTTPVPGGDLPVPLPTVNPYEDETLHVRITGGQENARTYLSLDVTKVPSTAQITGGVLTLPLAPSEAETEDDKLARFQACLSIPPEKGTAGSVEEPPEIDCKIKSGAIFAAKPKPHFLVDLHPFAQFVTTSGLALVPTDKAREEGDTWHVVFYGKKNESKDADPITAELLISELSPPSAAEELPPLQPQNDAPALGGGGGFESGSVNIGVPASSTPELNSGGGPQAPDAEEEATSQRAVAAPEASPVVAVGPAYTIVWALPLILLAMGIYFSSALTREIVGQRRG